MVEISMARRKESEKFPKAVLTNNAARKLNDIAHDLIRPRPDGSGPIKKVVVLINDEEIGCIRELGSGKTMEYRVLKQK